MSFEEVYGKFWKRAPGKDYAQILNGGLNIIGKSFRKAMSGGEKEFIIHAVGDHGTYGLTFYGIAEDGEMAYQVPPEVEEQDKLRGIMNQRFGAFLMGELKDKMKGKGGLKIMDAYKTIVEKIGGNEYRQYARNEDISGKGDGLLKRMEAIRATKAKGNDIISYPIMTPSPRQTLEVDAEGNLSFYELNEKGQRVIKVPDHILEGVN